ncbi:liver carboxylesterase 1-like [Episyrphus balteatus]|uniref:liver carboxylesterase 1-like n=1 Tax=Episyrphus balteatus TaxID=286459 RepID=UPI002485B41E|nr:liver carboxylesterase 1-like [Episyrphus balteatus]
MILNILFVLCCVLLMEISITQSARVKRIVGGKEAAKPPPDDPVVFTRIYNRHARVEGFRNPRTGVYTFLGLRFADPPVGPNRFSRPRYRRLEGDINATRHGPACPQPHYTIQNYVIGSEDCLLLNIYTPQMPDETTGLPVFVWIHPGAFRYGSAAQYDAEPLAQGGVIVVPIQYRLGTLGIIGDGSKEFNGNLAMFDMATALRWITEHISFFGGDPKQIKLIGHGSGAASAMFLSMSPRSGSVTGVVAMSGSALSQYAKDDAPVQSLEEIAQINKCPKSNETEIVSCLRKRSVKDIVIKDSQVQTERLQGRAMIKKLSGCVGFNPHVEQPDDGRGLPGIITDQPENSISKGNFSNIPLLIGVAKQETAYAINLNPTNDVRKSAENLLNSLGDSLGSLKPFLRVDELTGSIIKPILPGAEALNLGLTDLLKVPASLDPLQVISKVTELTTDALFNLPAVLTAQVWGKTASAFLYSFEYAGSTAKGINFLRGLPIVASEAETPSIGHGDELGYMFNANDIEGNPLPNTRLTKPEDIQVRKNFISLLTKFAQPQNSDKSSVFQSVSGGRDGTPFIKIDTKLNVVPDFRVCELLLWGAPLKPLQSTTCQGFAKTIGSVTKILSNVTTGLTDTLNIGGGGRGGGLLNVGGLLG